MTHDRQLDLFDAGQTRPESVSKYVPPHERLAAMGVVALHWEFAKRWCAGRIVERPESTSPAQVLPFAPRRTKPTGQGELLTTGLPGDPTSARRITSPEGVQNHDQ